MTMSRFRVFVGVLTFWCLFIRPAATSELSCEQAWGANPISSSCKATVSAVEGRPPRAMIEPQGNGQCRITVTCRNAYGGGTPNEVEGVSVIEVKSLHICNGILQRESCGDLFRP
ncbi:MULTISPECIES: hypothetical protein [Pseudomonas]|uniref:hypothetical protein n=1 Tax=Pseudomonas TaxID=286 RepID=UPI000877062C|nr:MULTISPECIES: hypothetical protein [Pseudomonas]MDB6445104.1 hypothetical protein [Pseudomonas sp. 21TX0197]MDT8907599.1 hypothetical protein [Pseudomonas prosekii]NHN70286.1 hypothetical protein [Pseudomonas fluorescens]ROO39209.1 hypothetical protein BIV08_18270 [Pseudomonas sp. AF76]SCX64910.1 hypothetical protein SAMN03159507_03006 [Pseudomonas sp. NFACC32-1]